MAEAKKWQEESGPDSDVVISTRIRLARNLPKLPFPGRMNEEQSRLVEQAVCRAVEHSSAAISGSLHYVELQDLTKAEKVSMVERHLVSPEFIGKSEGRALFLSHDERVSIMVNEEDHLRIQSMQEGLPLEKAYQIANALDDALNTSLHFAFDDTLGYLTQCPTNLGTGMRASVMLHLPSLQSSGQLSRISNHLSKLGLTLRGTYGEGSESVGALYQLSNQVSLGLSEEEAITNLKTITQQLIEQERSARQKMMQDNKKVDTIARSLGILQSARMMSSEEFMQLISNVRLGISTGILQNISYETINQLLVQTQPATMSLAHGGNLSAEERDSVRAELVRNTLTGA
jgi:protein arginine kinase